MDLFYTDICYHRLDIDSKNYLYCHILEPLLDLKKLLLLLLRNGITANITNEFNKSTKVNTRRTDLCMIQ
jgi:hypothetical protein